MQDYVDDIRAKYTKDWSSKDLFKQQMGVALYFIDKLALRAGHEKDEDEADTVGCCTLKVSFQALHAKDRSRLSSHQSETGRPKMEAC